MSDKYLWRTDSRVYHLAMPGEGTLHSKCGRLSTEWIHGRSVVHGPSPHPSKRQCEKCWPPNHHRRWAWSPSIGQALFDICVEILDSVGDDDHELCLWVAAWNDTQTVGDPDLLHRMRRAVDNAKADGHHG